MMVSRLVYLDSGFSQAILLCNLLFQDDEALKPFHDDVGIETLKEFRIIIRRSVATDESQVPAFGSQDESKRESIEEIVKNHPALWLPPIFDQTIILNPNRNSGGKNP